MSNAYMVKWSDVVGKANIDKFVAIQTGLLLAMQKGKSEQEALNSVNQDDLSMWRTKRALLRKCGYEYDDKILIMHGWGMAKLEQGDLVWYMDTTHRNPKPYVEYISMSAYLDWLKTEDTGEPRQYNVTSMVKKVSREIQKPKERADIDFPEER